MSEKANYALAFLAALFLVAYVLSNEQRHASQVASLLQIQESRFTRNEGDRMWEAINQRPLLSDLPPAPWLQNEFDELKSQVEALEAEIRNNNR